MTSTAFPPELSGQTISTDIVWCGSTINLLNTGAGFEDRTGFALMASFYPAYLEDPRAALEHTYATLAQDSEVLAPLGEYPWCSYYASVRDRFGVTWLLLLATEPTPIPALIGHHYYPGTAADAAPAYLPHLPGHVMVGPERRAGQGDMRVDGGLPGCELAGGAAGHRQTLCQPSQPGQDWGDDQGGHRGLRAGGLMEIIPIF